MASRIQRGASRSEGDLRVALQSPEITRVEKEVKRAEKAALTAQVGLDLSTVGGRLRWKTLSSAAEHRLENARWLLDTLKKMEVLQMRYEKAVLQKNKCHKTMVKWSEAHAEALKELNTKTMLLAEIHIEKI